MSKYLTLPDRNKKYNELIEKAKSGDDDAFDELIDMLMPLIKDRVNYYHRKSSLPRDLMELDAITQVQKAIQNYNPSRSNNFESYARSYIDKVRRTAYEHANIGSIPEHRITKVNAFNYARDRLTSRLKRQPASTELADELNWSVKEVDRMQKELKKELVLDDAVDSFDQLSQDDQDMLHYIRFELQPTEQRVYERLVGLNTGAPMSPKEIARDLKMPVTDVYNMKNKLTKKIAPILREY